jgi:Fuc2NAc and GlcNAc transferase
MALLMCLVAMVGSSALTLLARQYALSRKVMDVPNVRSSHSTPIPRGGGVAIVLTVQAAILFLAWGGAIPWPDAWGLLGGGVAVAVIGFVDDHGFAIAPLWRLLVHAAAASWVVFWLGTAAFVLTPGLVEGARGLAALVAVLYLAWMINLSNFMDGIDGIAGVETVTVCVCGALLGVIAAGAASPVLLAVLLASATAGFLVWNWPPAKVFLGDVGSGFLGLMLGALSLLAGRGNAGLSWSWFILLGVFVVDATTTLMRRVLRGERFHEAHRSHAYQNAARRWGSHARVSAAVAAVNVCWLFPIALAVTLGGLTRVVGVLLAYGPLVVGAVWLKAGKRT